MTTLESPPRNGFDRYFVISERGSSIRQEIRGGTATFFTMADIVVLNPLIIRNPGRKPGPSGPGGSPSAACRAGLVGPSL